MGFVSHDFFFLSKILNANKAVPSSCANEVVGTTKGAYSSIVETLKMQRFPSFMEIEYLNTAICESNSNLVGLFHEGHRTEVVVRIGAFIDFGPPAHTT